METSGERVIEGLGEETWRERIRNGENRRGMCQLERQRGQEHVRGMKRQ